MLAALLSLTLVQTLTPGVSRDDFGVAHVRGSSWEDAFYRSGYAVAEDRLWQMENSRRLARGTLAEIYGEDLVKTDRETKAFAYTDDELRSQYQALTVKAKEAIDGYCRGVNAYIERARHSNTLPPGYAASGATPTTWTPEDSIAIGVRLFDLFGRGGAGELRNMAMVAYLKQQAHAKDHVLDIFDDFAWELDRDSIPTLPRQSDPQASNPPLKVGFTRSQTESQLKSIPTLGLFELLPAINLASRETSTRVAERMNLPYKVGSYCVVVGPERSAIGRPLLLSGPQMGFTSPSIVHEISIEAPGLRVAGIDVPGLPGVVVGMTPSFAWGITSGVADTEDIFDLKGEGEEAYRFANASEPVQTLTFPIKVKGDKDESVTQRRTRFGPVVLHSHGHFFVRRSAYRGVEMQSLDALFAMYGATTANEVESVIQNTTMNFNFFYAMPTGDFGYRYLGRIPIRAAGIDPRFPTPGEPANDWQGFLPPDKMPHARNLQAGILANWNNKPTGWWPNYDTPVWGRIFRNEVLLSNLTKPKMTAQDLEMAAWNIARSDETFPYFRPFLERIKASDGLSPDALSYLRSFDGKLIDGSIAASIYLAWFEALRSEIFVGTTGNFISPDLFRLAAQPSLMINALEKRTRVNYLGKRTASEVAQAAFDQAVQRLTKSRGSDISLWRYKTTGIAVPGEPPIPYSNRGSYIQIIELLKNPAGRNVLTPGEAETGPNSKDQAPLARSWRYKPMGYGG